MYPDNEHKKNDCRVIIDRFEKDEKMKLYNVCYWLNGRNINFKVSFKYNFKETIKWNIQKYRNFLRLKVRLKERTNID